MSYYDEIEIPTLETALGFANVEYLQKMAQLTGDKVPTKKADLVALIRSFLSGDRLRLLWESLDDVQRAAVAETIHSDSTQFNARLFRAKYDHDLDLLQDAPYGSGHKATPIDFFFYRHRVIPDDLAAHLRAFVPEPEEEAIGTVDPLPATYSRPIVSWKHENRAEGSQIVPLTVHETELAAQRELISILRLVDAGKVAVSPKTYRPSAAAMDAITALLENGEYYQYVIPKDEWSDENAGPIRAFAWPMLLQAGGLAQVSGPRLQLTKAGRKALSEPPADTLRGLWAKWRSTKFLDELSRVDCVKGQTGKGKHGLTALSGRREAVALSLAECPVGAWIDIDEFLFHMEATDNQVLVTRNPWALYIAELQYGSLGHEGGSVLLSSRYVMALLLEYAATLGMIDVALVPPADARNDFRDSWGTDELEFFSRYDGLIYFRLTALGAYCLGVAARYQQPSTPVKAVLRILPTLEIEANPEIEKGDFLALTVYAVPVGDFVWRLDGGQLLTAIESGRQLEEIRTFLETRCAGPLPAEATSLLDEVAGRLTSVRDCGAARLIECADADLAARIAGELPTRKHCRRAGERHLVVAASAEAAFRRALREMGYLLSAEGQRPAKKQSGETQAAAQAGGE